MGSFNWYIILSWRLIASEADPAFGIIDYVSKGGFIFLLLVIIYGGMKKWWVFGWQYEECRRSEEQWKEVALKSQHIADTSATLGEKLVDRRSSP